MAKRVIGSILLLLASSFAMAGPKDELPISLECGDPVVEVFAHAGRDVGVSRKHCVDKMGPDANGLYEFYYEYDLYEFEHASEILHARSYTDEPEEAHLLGIEREGKRELLSAADLGQPLPEAALAYLRGAGKSNLKWLDPTNEVDGYSPVP